MTYLQAKQAERGTARSMNGTTNDWGGLVFPRSLVGSLRTLNPFA